jgi:penicillin-binding protein A
MTLATRSKKRRSGRSASILIWSLPLLLLVAFIACRSRLEHREQVGAARLALLETRLHEARDIYTRLGTSIWVGEEARAGLFLTEALDDELPMPTRPPASSEAVDGFPLRLLLHEALRQGRYGACLRLSRLLREDGAQFAAVYEAASLLELGHWEESRAVLDGLPPDQAAGWLAGKLSEVHSVLPHGVSALVQDRRGRPIGWRGPEGELQPLGHIDAHLLPVEAIEEALGDDLTRSVRLSIDLDLSRLAYSALGRYRGSIVLISTQTGEILAAVSDRQTRRREVSSPFTQEREPASISKLITTTAALRAGIDPDAEIGAMTCRAAERYDGHFLYCAYRAGPLRGLNRAMAVSCNVAFANLGVRMGWDHMASELRRFGFDRDRKGQLSFGRILAPGGGDRRLADLSIGLDETAITPVHAALLAAVFANGGRMPEPTLISSSDGLLGLSPRPFGVEKGEPVIDAEWVPVVLGSMLSVVESGGTAFNVAPPEFPVAMKTGTGATPGLGFHTNYVGIGPLPDPKVAFSVRITGQRTSRQVRYASFRVTRSLLNSLSGSQPLLLDHPGPPPGAWTTHFESPHPETDRVDSAPTAAGG